MIFMKKIITAIIAILTMTSIANAQSDIQININGEKFENQIAPIVKEDRVLVPMREIFENFGAEVFWDDDTKTVTAVLGSEAVLLQIDNNLLFKPGETIEMDVAPVIVNERTMVPLRAVAAGLGAEVEWDDATRCVNIDFDEGETEENILAEEIIVGETIPVSIEIDGYGTMTAELYPELAPETVENFVKLANEGFYDGLVFHRVIDGFMIQGGGYDTDMNLKETDSIPGEFYANGFDNPLKHTRGTLSMARTSEYNSASSQFFITDEDSEYLDGGYAAFGRLTDGYDVLDRIAETETHSLSNGMEDVPVDLPVIKSIRAEIDE